MFSGLTAGGGGGLSLLKILGGLSKTIGIARQILPIYQDVKPLLQGVPKVFTKLSDLQNRTREISTMVNSGLYTNSTSQTEEIPKTVSNGPTFFQ